MKKTLVNWLQRIKPEGAFARGVGVLVGGTAGAQLLLMLASPLLSRLYSPEDFGLVAVYTSLLALIGVIGSLRYELAIPLPEDDAEAMNVIVLSLFLVSIFSFVTVFVTLFFGHKIANILRVPAIEGYIWLLPVGVFLSGAYNVFYYWAVRTKRFATIAGTKLSQVLAMITLQLAAYKLGGIALLLGQVAGQSMGITRLALPIVKTDIFKVVTLVKIKKVAIRYIKFAKFETWSSLVNTASWEAPATILALMVSPSAAGLYALANRVLLLPKFMITSAIGEVFLSHASEANRNNSLNELVIKVYSANLVIVTIPLMLISIMGPKIFSLIFGLEWREAGVVAQIMTFSLIPMFCLMPFTRLFLIFELQLQGMLFHLFLLILRTAPLIYIATYYSLNYALVTLSFCTILGWSMFAFWLSSILKISVFRFLKLYFVRTFEAALVLLPLLLVTETFNKEYNFLYFLETLVSALPALLVYIKNLTGIRKSVR